MLQIQITSDTNPGALIGVTTKKAGNLVDELFTDRDTYCVSCESVLLTSAQLGNVGKICKFFFFLVSMGMSPRGKALLMATAVLIDFLFFEDNAGYDSI